MAMKVGELATALEVPQVFTHEQFGEIRTILEGDEILFVVPDVCKALEHTNPTMALRALDDDEKAALNIVEVSSNGVTQRRNVNVVTEAGLYRLIFMSRKPNAKEFQRWIFHEVIPAIRKHGFYVTPDYKVTPDFLRQIADQLEAKDQQIAALTGENGELKDTVAAQATQIENMKPKACYHDVILACKDTVATTTIAKDYGMSAIKFNKLLHELGVQFKQSGIWYLYQTYAALGWTQTRTANYVKDGEVHAKVYSSWTQTGRFGLYELLKERGYLPKIEQREKTPECVEQQLSF